MTMLTVGPGKTFATIAAAVAASAPGDTVSVDAGNYTETDVMIAHDLTLVTPQGTTFVTPVPGAHTTNVGKGIFITGDGKSTPNVTIDGFDLSGAKSGSANGAGIRYQSGNLTVLRTKFHDNEDGILATPFLETTGTISVDQSIFDHNGSGSGQSHNMYIGYVNSFTLTNSISTNANVGHLVKCRALHSTLRGNHLFDGPTGTSSYHVDLANGGDHDISDNLFEKGPKASSPIFIHSGGSPLPHQDQNVRLNTNTFDSSANPKGVGLWNADTHPVTGSGNKFISARLLRSGYCSLTGNVDGSGNPLPDLISNDYNSPSVTTDYRGVPGDQAVTVAKSGQTYQGGAGHLTFANPSFASLTILAGAGGIDYTGHGTADFVTTSGGASNVTLAGPSTIQCGGDNDTVVTPAAGEIFMSVTGGHAKITNNSKTASPLWVGWDAICDFTTNSGHEVIAVRPGGTLNMSGISGGFSLTATDAKAVTFDYTDSKGAAHKGAFSGGGVGMTDEGDLTAYLGAQTSAVINLAAGSFTLNNVAGAVLDAGAATVTISSATAAPPVTVIAGSGAASLKGPGTVQVVRGRNDGGTVNLTGTLAGNAAVALLGVTAGTPTASGATTTLPLSNGTKLIYPTAKRPGFTPPPAAAGLSVSLPDAVTVIAGQVAAVQAALQDAYAAAASGLCLLTLTAQTGSFALAGNSGASVSFQGTWADLLTAVAAAGYTPAAAATADSWAIDVWNQAGVHAGATAAITVVPQTVTATPPPLSVQPPDATDQPAQIVVTPPPITVTPAPLVATFPPVSGPPGAVVQPPSVMVQPDPITVPVPEITLPSGAVVQPPPITITPDAIEVTPPPVTLPAA